MILSRLFDEFYLFDQFYTSFSNHFIIKRLPPGYIECLVNCFNVWLSECRYPNHWKLAKIVTLNKLKAGVPRCDQTRPISLLATHSKLFEKIILEREELGQRAID